MKYNFQASRENRLQRANKLADKNESKSKALFEQAHAMASMIPFGQPVLVGHHSEKRHRRHLKGIHDKMGKAFEAQDKAHFFEKRAETIENSTAIYSDDPAALSKLENQLEGLKAAHAFMKKANKYVKTKDREGFLNLEGATVKMWDEVTTDRFGFSGFGLSNSNQNIKRVERRIAELKKMEGRTTKEIVINGARLVENVEANRVQLIFPERLSREDYGTLRKLGFIYCRSEGAFQRKLNSHAISIAKGFLEKGTA